MDTIPFEQSDKSIVNIGGLTHSNFVMDDPTATQSNFKVDNSKKNGGRYEGNEDQNSSALHMRLTNTHSNMYKTNFAKSSSQI